MCERARVGPREALLPDLPLHAALVHLPLGLAFATPLVALGVAVAHRRGRPPRTAFAIVTGLQLLLAASGIAAVLAGHRDERRVERIVGERVIEVHEERGEASVWTAAGVAALTIALLVVPARAAGAVAAGDPARRERRGRRRRTRPRGGAPGMNAGPPRCPTVPERGPDRLAPPVRPPYPR